MIELLSKFTEEEITKLADDTYLDKNVRMKLLADGFFLSCGKIWNVFKCCLPIGWFELEDPDGQISLKQFSDIEKKNVTNFYSLLLKIDKRVNPHLYSKNYQENKI